MEFVTPLNQREVLAQSPSQEFGPYRISPPQEVAAGLTAVLSSLAHMQRGPGTWRGLTLLRNLNQVGGFDCSSCAWPDPPQRSLAEFCENGAKAMADEATRKVLDRQFFARYSVQELSRWSDFELNQAGRLTQPLWLESHSDHYRPIEWEQAFELLAQELRQLDHPDQAAFYTSGRTSNEAAFLYQLLARRFGTNNLPDCANLCHESSGVGLGQTLGITKGNITLDDLHQADLILVVGQNPGTNHPRMLTSLETAKKNGARLVSINPLPEAALVRFKNPQDFLNPGLGLQTLLGSGREMADLHLPLTLNSDVALFNYLCLRLLQRGALDQNFIESSTAGYDDFCQHLSLQDPQALLEACRLTCEQVEPLVEWLAASRRLVICWAMGLTQHVNGVDNIKALVNLALLKGGAGLCPVRGHSNVQGDRTMGITCRPKPAFLEALGQHFGFSPPNQPGLDTMASIQAMLRGQLKVLVCLGGNFLPATPDSDLTAQALKSLKLTAQISTKLNRSHLVTGQQALILPCLGRSEVDPAGFVTVENSMSIVHSSQGKLPPASQQLRSEVAIVCGLAQALLQLDWAPYTGDYDRIRNDIAATIPGFENYNQRVRQSGGFALPMPTKAGKFPTSDGKAHFSSVLPPDLTLAPGHYRMMTIRSHDQFNTTIYGLNDRYRGISGRRRILLINPQDAAQAGFKSGDFVDLLGAEGRRADNFMLVPYPIPSGNLASYFPETNPLIPLEQISPDSRTPACKSVIVQILARLDPN